MTQNMRETLVDLLDYVTYGEGCEEACKRCPYASECGKEEWFWGCPCWEEGMGDDL